LQPRQSAKYVACKTSKARLGDSTQTSTTDYLTAWHLGGFGHFRKKTLPNRTWLCASTSQLLFGLRTWSKHQKTRQVY